MTRSGEMSVTALSLSTIGIIQQPPPNPKPLTIRSDLRKRRDPPEFGNFERSTPSRYMKALAVSGDCKCVPALGSVEGARSDEKKHSV